MLSMNPSPCR